ncbi:MAG: hypothetical protein ACRDRP_06325 [Pseudonocardiaceae bacterium]
MTQYRTDEGLPPLAPPDASDTERNRAIVARMVARHGAPSLDEYRRVYAACGLDWPGDDEVRRRPMMCSGRVGRCVVASVQCFRCSPVSLGSGSHRM